MKKFALPVLLAITTVALALVCVRQSQRLAQRRTEVVQLQGELKGQEQQLGEVKAVKEHLNRQRSELLGEVSQQSVELSRQAKASRQAQEQATVPTPSTDPTNADSGAAGFGKLFAKMMEDPDTRKFLREQQRMMMNQLYGPLIKQMGLAPEQAEKFSEILADHAAQGAEKASSLFGGGTNRTQALTALSAENRAQEDQIKELLGETRYAQYKEYQQTAGERMQLNMFQQQTGGDFKLSEPQTEQLLSIMREEKQSVAAAGQPIPGLGQDPANAEAFLGAGQTEALVQNLESINERVLERAKTVLGPDQLTAFARFQTNQVQTMRMGLSMAQKFLNPEKSSSGPLAQP